MPAAKRPYHDPVKKDWAIITDGTAGGGNRREDPSYTSTVLYLLDLRKGSAAAFPDLGSRFHTIRKITADSLSQSELMVFEALEPLTAPKKINSLTARATREARTVIMVEVSWKDRAGKRYAIKKSIGP